MFLIKRDLFGKTSTCCFLYGVSYMSDVTVYSYFPFLRDHYLISQRNARHPPPLSLKTNFREKNLLLQFRYVTTFLLKNYVSRRLTSQNCETIIGRFKKFAVYLGQYLTDFQNLKSFEKSTNQTLKRLENCS